MDLAGAWLRKGGFDLRPGVRARAQFGFSVAGGRVQGCVIDGISVFRGIPYGAPTGGSNRFRAPQPPEPWTGVRSARRYGDTAPQHRSFLSVGGEKGNRPAILERRFRLPVDHVVAQARTPSPS